ncbi:hypothetical protein SEA_PHRAPPUCCINO_41 [Mycobacterium phage Phrappuccino]|uniref:Cro protein n=1 Tax=Mycobacterium phage Phrappuccino TaxID=2591223 RepID=A0A514DDN6_9CAUD|nr:transcriptional repressor [Mycobacterium phage Phrappuccino]QDH91718.1 hypothetical protein SEA_PHRAPPUCCINO_41 [Mycobacterium phage Phrappuccino]QIQ63161.1 hypothetical protein SEA_SETTECANDELA_41 [Mycobacterium phage Settecandela]
MGLNFQKWKPAASVASMSASSLELHWIPESVSNLMRANGVRDRADLAKKNIGIGQTTIYRSFDERWGGKVQANMLHALAVWTQIPLSQLVLQIVVDPTAVLDGKPRAKRRSES